MDPEMLAREYINWKLKKFMANDKDAYIDSNGAHYEMLEPHRIIMLNTQIFLLFAACKDIVPDSDVKRCLVNIAEEEYNKMNMFREENPTSFKNNLKVIMDVDKSVADFLFQVYGIPYDRDYDCTLWNHLCDMHKKFNDNK